LDVTFKWVTKFSAYLVLDKNTEEPLRCPKDKQNSIVYNGNYYCSKFNIECDWALAHPARSKRDKRICDLIGIDYW
jgi:hypothetical protein